MKTKHRRSIDYPDNIIGFLTPFITGMLPTEVNNIDCMLNLLKSKNFVNTIYCWQPVVCKEIINISDREMKIEMGDEIRATIINDKGDKHYEEWINLIVSQRDKIGMVITYGIYW